MSSAKKRTAGRTEAARPIAAETPERAQPSGSRAAAVLGVAALCIYFAWVFAIGFRPVSNNDFWLHLKIGEEVLAGGSVPEVDTWSATAAGRPYLAHGWLSAVLFALLHRVGPWAMSALCAALALGTAALVVLARPRRALGEAVALPLLAIGTYAIAHRFSARPHLFSLIAFAALVFALERWRVHRSWKRIAWLPLLFVLWVNLHGGFLFGLGFLWAFALGVGAQVALGNRCGSERFERADVKPLALVALGCTLVTLLNPFGPRALLFPITMSEQSDFLKEFIAEWESPFTASFRDANAFVFGAFVGMLTASWIPVLATLRRRLPIDAGLLAIVTVMAVRANRFIPEVAIAGLPIALRAWSDLAVARGWSIPRRRPFAEVLALGTLLTLALTFGFAQGPSRRWPTGSGYAGGLPYAEVARMKELGLEGVVFNELADGALIIHDLGPALRPVMDARLDLYGEELYSEYRASREGPQDFLAYLERHRVDYVFLYAQRSGMSALLGSLPGWQLLFHTPTHFLFARKPG